MKLNLTKPLIVFDLETTGLDMVKDQNHPDLLYQGISRWNRRYVKTSLSIQRSLSLHEVVALTGISNDDVKDAPTFKQLAATFNQEFSGCDFAGYNSNHFDVPMLAEEFLRAGIDFDFI